MPSVDGAPVESGNGMAGCASVSDVIRPAAGLGGLSDVFRHFCPPKKKLTARLMGMLTRFTGSFETRLFWMENVIASMAWETIDIRGTFGILPNFIGRIS